jgi:hypothetical protein
MAKKLGDKQKKEKSKKKMEERLPEAAAPDREEGGERRIRDPYEK